MYSHWLELASLAATHLSAPPGSWLWSRHPRTTSHLSNEDVTIVPGPCPMFPQCEDSGSLCWKTCLGAQREVDFPVLLVSTSFATLPGGPGVCRADANPCTQPAVSTGSLGLTGMHLQKVLAPGVLLVTGENVAGNKGGKATQGQEVPQTRHRPSQRAHKQGP